MKIRFQIVVCFLFLAVSQMGASSASDWGSFKGPLKLELVGERDGVLLENFEYEDQYGKLWIAPKNARVNGASIPPILFSIVGSPWVGTYRHASVLHDYHCDAKMTSWQQVHRMFYNASRAAGTGAARAKLMYAAVVYFGPKWVIEDGVDGKTVFEWQNPYDEEQFRKLEKWVSKNDPSLDEIENLVR